MGTAATRKGTTAAGTGGAAHQEGMTDSHQEEGTTDMGHLAEAGIGTEVPPGGMIEGLLTAGIHQEGRTGMSQEDRRVVVAAAAGNGKVGVEVTVVAVVVATVHCFPPAPHHHWHQVKRRRVGQ